MIGEQATSGEAGPSSPSQEPTSAPPSVSVTIVNHRSRDLLRNCLASLRGFPYAAGEMEIVVLDNASNDGSVEMLRTEYPEVVVLAESVRRGFGANQNRAVAASHGDAIFMLNPDAVVHEHTIDRLVAALYHDDRVTIAGGPIANDDNSLRQDRPHPFPSPLSPYLGAFGLQRFRPRRPVGREVIRDGWPSGAAFVIERAAFNEIGGFDEDFFMYSEDADLFTRLLARDHLLAWVPEAIVTHPFPDEPSEMSERREAEIVNAELRYMSKHFGRAFVFRVGVMIESTAKLVVLSVPGFSRLIRHHGKTRVLHQRAQRARLAAAIVGNRRPSLGDLAFEWNQRYAPRPPEITADSDHRKLNATEPHAGGAVAGAEQRNTRRLIVFDSSTTWDAPWMAFQHIALHLAERAPVLFVDAPLSPITSYRHYGKPVWRSQLRRISDNLYRLTPVAPPGLTRRGISRLTEKAIRRAVAQAISYLNADVQAFLCSLSHADIFDVADAQVRVYYASDDFQAGAGLMGRPAARIRKLDERLASEADTIVAVSPAIADAYRLRGYDPVLVPNGVENEVFEAVDDAPVADDVTLRRPIAGYVGQISDRMDLDLVEAVAKTGVSVLFVGARQGTFGGDARMDELIAYPNVQWVGPKPFDALPSYLRVIDVGLVPYTDSDFNRASFPLKTLEYLAAGRPVVATPLPAIAWLDTDLIVTADNPEDFARRTVEEAARPRSPALVERRRAFAANHSWSKRVDHLAHILKIETE